MAPECIQEGQWGPAADIWAIGVTLIELLDGKPGFSELDGLTAVMKIVSEEEYPVPESLSHEIKQVLSMCFQRNPDDRPSSEELLGHALFAPSRTRTASKKSDMMTPEELVDISGGDWTRPPTALEQEKLGQSLGVVDSNEPQLSPHLARSPGMNARHLEPRDSRPGSRRMSNADLDDGVVW